MTETAQRRIVQVCTGSRLHFGLLDTVAPFGGAGVMIEQPATTVSLLKSESFACCQHDRPRVEAIATRLTEFFEDFSLPQCHVHIERRAMSHCGLGSGTQLSLAVAEALCVATDRSIDRESLAIAIADRGRRSAIGIHGYFRGGMIVEFAEDDRELNPIQHRIELPESWTALVVKPQQPSPTVSGDLETKHFANLAATHASRSKELRSWILRHLVPAAQQQHFADFCVALHQYNRLSGQLFAAIQGGPYNGDTTAALVETLMDRGAQGVGQSSWGPGVFSWFPDRQQAETFAEDLPDDVEVIAITAAKNQPRDLKRDQT